MPLIQALNWWMSAVDWVADRQQTKEKRTSMRTAWPHSQVENDDKQLPDTTRWPAYCLAFANLPLAKHWHCLTLPLDTPPRRHKMRQCPMPSTPPERMKAHSSTIRSRVWRKAGKAEQVGAKSREWRPQSTRWEVWLDCWQCFSESGVSRLFCLKVVIRVQR